MQQFDSFAQMQRDAERRVMEMQKRAMAAVESSDPPPIIIPEPTHGSERDAADGAPTEMPAFSDETAVQPAASPSPLNELFPGLNLSDEDAERALIIAVLLLIREQADRNLILLLLYLMM